MVAFYGVRPYVNTSLGISVCGLVACENSSLASCGRISIEPAVNFDSISIWGSFANNSDTSVQPATLLTNMNPLTSEYSYCVEGLAGSTRVNVSLKTRTSVSGLRTFGILGRVYNLDNSTPGPRSAGNISYKSLSVFSLLMIIMTICFA